MNEHLRERFGRSKGAGQRRQGEQAEVLILQPKLNSKIREYYEPKSVEGGQWLRRPEMPTAAELMDNDTEESSSDKSSDIIELEPNKPLGAFKSKEQYLSTHYELLREDAVRPLREAVCKMRNAPAAVEETFSGQIGIYEKVSESFSPSHLA